VIEELKLRSNQACSHMTKKHVTDWLENRPLII
jgi:hypothetical protein